MNENIERAIEKFRRRAGRYARNERYYRGDHDLAFATEKFENAFGSLFREFALNLCPAVCDAVKDKLRVTGFGVEGSGNVEKSHLPPRPRSADTPPIQEGSMRNLHGAASNVWHANRMGVRAGEVHKEALKNGDAYLIVWPGADGKPVMYPNRASTCVVFYDEEQPGRILWAAKYWRGEDKRLRLNLFYPDRIEKYVSREPSETGFCEPAELVLFEGDAASGVGDKSVPAPGKRDAASGVADEGVRGPRGGGPVVENPYGVVPVFHFANNSDIGRPGVSELEAAIPIQDGLNKSVLDMLVAMEYSAYRQRWAAGIELETDKATGDEIAPFKAGVAHLWVSTNPEARFGDFASADLAQFLKVKDGFRIDIASVTGTPLHYLQPLTRVMPSGESLRRSESRFIAKVRDRQAAFGEVWADAMAFALRIEGFDGVDLVTQWEDPAAFSERERLENLLLEKKIGISGER